MSMKCCGNRSAKKASKESLESDPSDNKFAILAAASKENMVKIKEARSLSQTSFNNPRFKGSVVIYFNNIKQNQKLNPFFHLVKMNAEAFTNYFNEINLEQTHPEHLSPRLLSPIISFTERVGGYVPNLEVMEKIEKTKEFQRHLKLTIKIMHTLLGLAVSGDASTASLCLQRIGAIHAELGIPARLIFNFEDSFNLCLEHTLDHDKKVFHLWHILIQYMVYMMVKGMNDHYAKVRFVYWSAAHHGKCTLKFFSRPKLFGLNSEASMSLRNMAKTVEAMQD